jgi:hemerythrin
VTLEWNEVYALHHEKIDAQHKGLFRIANIVEVLDPNRTSKGQLAIIMKQFFEYMREHIKDEEAYMKSIEYPFLQEHEKMHEKIIDELTDILKQSQEIVALIDQIKIVSHQWLVGHILQHDQHIQKWFSSHTVELDDYA